MFHFPFHQDGSPAALPRTGGYWEGYTYSLGGMHSGLLPAGPPGKLVLQDLSPKPVRS